MCCLVPISFWYPHKVTVNERRKKESLFDDEINLMPSLCHTKKKRAFKYVIAIGIQIGKLFSCTLNANERIPG